MKISIKGFIINKAAEHYSDCADRYAYNPDAHKFAISDGVSKSFFPKIWSDILVNEFVKQEETDQNFILKCQKEWLEKVTEIMQKPDIKWYTKNAFNRRAPGLATFVGLQFYTQEKNWKWKAEALGDSFLFFIPEKLNDFDQECFLFSSKPTPPVFDNFPDYYSSIDSNHKGQLKRDQSELKNGTFYLMTDALAEWFINEKENAIGKIKVWLNQNDFERFIDEERQSGKLGNDDSAILIINTSEVDQLTTEYEEDVSDIKKLIIQEDWAEKEKVETSKKEKDPSIEKSEVILSEEKKEEESKISEIKDSEENQKQNEEQNLETKNEEPQEIQEEPPLNKNKEVIQKATTENSENEKKLSDDKENNNVSGITNKF